MNFRESYRYWCLGLICVTFAQATAVEVRVLTSGDAGEMSDAQRVAIKRGNRQVMTVYHHGAKVVPVRAAARINDIIVNADFSEGLDSWTVAIHGGDTTPGEILVEDEQAVLLEGGSFLVTLEQSFEISGGLQELSFDVIFDPGFDLADDFMPDAFEAQLLDDSGASVVPTWDPDATSTTLYDYDINDRLLNEQVTTVVADAPQRQRQQFAASGTAIPSRGMYQSLIAFLSVSGLLLFWPVWLLVPRSSYDGKRSRRRRIFIQTIILFVLPTMLTGANNVNYMGASSINYMAYGDPADAGVTDSTTGIAYDDNGNTLTRSRDVDTDTYTFDYRNRLVAANVQIDNLSDSTFDCDVDGIRVAKTVAGDKATDFLVDKNRRYAQVLTETNASLLGDPAESVSYVHGDDLLSMTRPDSGTLYYAYDGQMSTRQLVDGAEAVSDTFVYDAFGVDLHRSGVTENLYRYTGEQFDPNLSFYYLRARYYVQFVGRFLGMDLYEGPNSDPGTLHKYAYAHARPTFGFDPSGMGLFEFTAFLGRVVGTVSAALTNLSIVLAVKFSTIGLVPILVALNSILRSGGFAAVWRSPLFAYVNGVLRGILAGAGNPQFRQLLILNIKDIAIKIGGKDLRAVIVRGLG